MQPTLQPTLPNQMPVPPTDMVMPAAYHGILVSNTIVLAVIVLVVLRYAIKHKNIIPVFIMLGAVLASLTECIWDVLDAVWYPQYGAVPLYRLINVSVPMWDLLAYPCYLGGLGFWVYTWLTKGMTQRAMWTFFALGWAANCVLEMPALHMATYVYYGPQPFKVLGFPLWQAMGNGIMPLTIGGIAYGWREILTGPRALLMIPAVPVAQIIALGGVGWPTMLAMNSGLGYAATYPASILSFGISLMMVYFISVKLCRPATVPAASTAPGYGVAAAE